MGISVGVYRRLLFCFISFFLFLPDSTAISSQTLSALKKDQRVGDLQVVNLYGDSEGGVIGAKLLHIPTRAPIYLLQLETVPQVFTWVNTPADSNRGLAHSLEHLLQGKGTRGRYYTLLGNMRLGQSSAGTAQDFVYYGFSCTAGTDGFFEMLHALLDTLYSPDFSDLEAEREFYHFSVASDAHGRKTLIESGTVYNEMLARQDLYDYYYGLSKHVYGEQSPFGFESGGAPQEMRGVTPEEIRHFHEKRYRAGPNTGFIFSFPPRDDVSELLQRISRELKRFGRNTTPKKAVQSAEPKYAIRSSPRFDPEIYPFPGTNPSAPGVIQLAWKPATAHSLLELKLLELFCQGLAGGENSLLQKEFVDSKEQPDALGATGVEGYVLPESEPRFPVASVEISGIPGNKITTERIEQIRRRIVDSIGEISRYPDHSAGLLSFNRKIESVATSMRRSQEVWIKNPPGFESTPPKKEWIQHLDRLEMDPSFLRSLTQEKVWQAIEDQLASGRNIWRDMIQNLHLFETPYAVAGTPSPALLESNEKDRQERIHKKISAIMEDYHTGDEQEALARFEQGELIKSKEIDKIEARVSLPHFTDHPPLVPDAGLRYKQFQLEDVPVIASLFDRPPTIDIGLSFDLRKIPSKYLKYLPLLPECLSSIGLNKEGKIVTYGELSSRIQREVYAFNAGYETNPSSKRADFTLRASATSVREFRSALELIRDVVKSNYLETSNAARLRDVVARRIANDQSAGRRDVAALASAYALLYPEDRLYFGLHSRFTTSHWDERLQWLLHEPVGSADIENLSSFATGALSPSICSSPQELVHQINGVTGSGLQHELVDYWKRNIYSFPNSETCAGLLRLTQEVSEDLKTGPESAIRELKELQRLILNRRALHVDLTLSDATLADVKESLSVFLQSIPPVSTEIKSEPDVFVGPVSANLQRRYQMSFETRPLYLAIMTPDLAKRLGLLDFRMCPPMERGTRVQRI